MVLQAIGSQSKPDFFLLFFLQVFMQKGELMKMQVIFGPGNKQKDIPCKIWGGDAKIQPSI